MHTLFGLLESSYVSLLESFLYSLTWLVELLISALSSLSTSMAGYENSLMKMSGYVGDYQWTFGEFVRESVHSSEMFRAGSAGEAL